MKAVQVQGTLTNKNEDWRLFWGQNLIFSDFFHCQKLPRIGWTFKEHIQQSIQQTISVKTGQKSSKSQIQSRLNWFFIAVLFCVSLSSAVQCYSKVQILDRTSHLCVKTVQIQDYCGESDQSKLRGTSLSGLVCLLCFIIVNHRHLPISRRSLKQNTENLLSKIVYQSSPKKI